MADDRTDELFLCRPCAERIKDFKTVRAVVIGKHSPTKKTCEQCARRRYGYLCIVEWKELVNG